MSFFEDQLEELEEYYQEVEKPRRENKTGLNPKKKVGDWRLYVDKGDEVIYKNRKAFKERGMFTAPEVSIVFSRNMFGSRFLTVFTPDVEKRFEIDEEEKAKKYAYKYMRGN